MARIFIISPFGKPFDTYFSDVIGPGLTAAGHQVHRADDIFAPGTIMATVYRSIIDADVIIADTTGINGNVFYELGIAHSHRKPVVILTQSSESVPFDIRHLRSIVYQPTEEDWGAKCISQLLKAINHVNSRKETIGESIFGDDTLLGFHLPSFAEVLSTAESVLRTAKNYFFVTRLTPNEGILPHETLYFEATRERIVGGKDVTPLPNYRRLIKINSRDDLDLAVGMLETYRSCPNFQMAVLQTSHVQVNFEMFVSDSRWSMIVFAAEQAGGAMESGLFFDDQRIANRWRAFFLNLWSHPQTVIVKSSGTLSAEALRTAERRIRQGYDSLLSGANTRIPRPSEG